ncbi:SLOG family protein [Streptomyces sp. NPDC059015]|uniref:SLOG family protein n=1 Tax=unclassified Streptomyces TaxID=2593676 RepID=UPI0036AEB614
MADRPYRILVTGSRDWDDVNIVRDILASAVYQNVPAVIVHGGCPSGPDAIASWWIRQHRILGLTEEMHRAEWRTDGQLDRSAGFRRNAHMVSLGANICLAFIRRCTKPKCTKAQPHGSHGTTHCADLAEKAGIPVRRWTA